MVEHLLAKEEVASSNLVFRSNYYYMVEVAGSWGSSAALIQDHLLSEHAN